MGSNSPSRFTSPTAKKSSVSTTPRQRHGLAGPGTINTPSTFSYNKIGDAWFNGFPVQTIGTNSASQYLGEYGALPALAWASYDASTNAPELYPNWISLQNLQSQLVAQLAPGAPPDGSVGSDYSFQFSANSTSFTPPFTWSALNSTFGGGISGLPPGLALTSGGLLWGTPTNAGTYDFTLLLNDSLGHSVQWNLSITIH